MEPRSDSETENLVRRSKSSDTVHRNDSINKYRRFPTSSILSQEPLDLNDLENCQMSVEEASCLLRDYGLSCLSRVSLKLSCSILEKEAFKAMITALRCQGPLTPYKECLIEHIKYALL